MNLTNAMRTKIVGIAAAVVLAGAGTAILVGYVHGAESRALKGDKTTSVLVVSAPIAKGTAADSIAGSVKTEKIPAKVRAAGAVSSLSSLSGEVAVVDLVPGEQLVATRFGSTAQAAGVPPGLLQVTVLLDPVRALGGAVRQGDTVGVLASFSGDTETTHLILQKVPVTAVRTDSGAIVKIAAASNEPTGKLLVTLAVDAPSAERVVFAAEHGTLWLTSEPSDANEGGTKVQTRGTVNG